MRAISIFTHSAMPLLCTNMTSSSRGANGWRRSQLITISANFSDRLLWNARNPGCSWELWFGIMMTARLQDLEHILNNPQCLTGRAHLLS
jgi:hypothetical protein